MRDWTKERERARTEAAQITGWCIVVALHQREGIGPKRLERCAEASVAIEDKVAAEIYRLGKEVAMRRLCNQTAKIGPAEFHVPQTRAPRTRREADIRLARNEAATASWCVFSQAAHEALGFGRAKLERLHTEARENYRQFLEWYEESPEWAFDRLRHCVQMALQEAVAVVEEEEAAQKNDAAYERMVQNAVRSSVYTMVAKERTAVLAANVLSAEARRAAMESCLAQALHAGL